jgi:AmiR/NasT family two-component response regulator
MPSKILIVEDESIVALDLEAKLRRLGYQVIGIADSGEEAIRVAEAGHPTWY